VHPVFPITVANIWSKFYFDSFVKLPALKGRASRKGNYLFQIASLIPALKGGACREANGSIQTSLLISSGQKQPESGDRKQCGNDDEVGNGFRAKHEFMQCMYCAFHGL
jgi:hypothetical protein